MSDESNTPSQPPPPYSAIAVAPGDDVPPPRGPPWVRARWYQQRQAALAETGDKSVPQGEKPYEGRGPWGRGAGPPWMRRGACQAANGDGPRRGPGFFCKRRQGKCGGEQNEGGREKVMGEPMPTISIAEKTGTGEKAGLEKGEGGGWGGWIWAGRKNGE